MLRLLPPPLARVLWGSCGRISRRELSWKPAKVQTHRRKTLARVSHIGWCFRVRSEDVSRVPTPTSEGLRLFGGRSCMAEKGILQLQTVSNSAQVQENFGPDGCKFHQGFKRSSQKTVELSRKPLAKISCLTATPVSFFGLCSRRLATICP